MNDNIIILKNPKLMKQEESLLNELCDFLYFIHHSKIIHLMHFLYTGLKYLKYDNPRQINIIFQYKIKIKRYFIIRFTLTHGQRWDRTHNRYIQTMNFDIDKNFFEIRLASKYIYLILMNYNGEFLLYDNKLRSCLINGDSSINTAHDIQMFQTFNLNHKKYIPSYSDIVGNNQFDNHNLINVAQYE